MIELMERYIVEEGLHKKNRKREIVYKRFYLAAWIKDQIEGISLDKIGSYFNNKHDWTLYALREYENYKDDNLFSEYTEDTRRLFPMGKDGVGGSHLIRMYKILASKNKITNN